MNLVTRWAMAGALLILAMPMAADAHPWNHNGWRAAARANMATNSNLVANPYLAQGQYAPNAKWAMRAERMEMRQAYLNNLAAQQMAMRNSYAAVPTMAYAPTPTYMASPYGGYGASPYGGYGASPYGSYGASPLSSLMAPLLSSVTPTTASSYLPMGQPGYGTVPGYGAYGRPYGSYLPTSPYGGQFPGRTMGYLPWQHLFNKGSTTTPIASTSPLTHTGGVTGATTGSVLHNLIR
jgi:hypothetical protein